MNAQPLTTLLKRAEVGSSLTPPAGLDALPWPLRLGLADLVTHARRGEQVALHCAQRMVALETDADALAFSVTQVRDERSHLAYFDAAHRQLGMERAVLAPLERLFAQAEQQETLPRVLLANHLIVETLAHDLFGEVSKHLAGLSGKRYLPRVWRATLGEVSAAMGGIARDESRHVAFGVLRLAAVRQALGPTQRVRLDLLAQLWIAELERTLETLPVLFLLEPSKRVVARSVVARCRQRCLDAGLKGVSP